MPIEFLPESLLVDGRLSRLDRTSAAGGMTLIVMKITTRIYTSEQRNSRRVGQSKLAQIMYYLYVYFKIDTIE